MAPCRSRSSLACAGIVCAAVSTASAQEREPGDPAAPDRVWRYAVEVYGFLPITLESDVTVGNQTVTFEADAGDVVDHLQAALAGRLEAWKQRFGYILEPLYLQYGTDGMGPAGTPFNVRVRTLATDFLVGAIVARFGERGSGSPFGRIELHGGIRGEFSESRLQIGAMPELDNDEDLLRFAGALQVPFHFTDQLSIRGRATFVGRHGFAASVLGVLEYTFDPVILAAGYRYDHLETDAARLQIETTAHNVYASFTLEFDGS